MLLAFWEFSLVRMPTDRAPQFTGKGQERACVVGVNPSPASVEPGGLPEAGNVGQSGDREGNRTLEGSGAMMGVSEEGIWGLLRKKA